MHRCKTSLKPLAYTALAAVTLGASALSTSVAVAGTSASVGVANLYLYRGLNLSDSAPQVHGSLDYGHDSGFYAGIWGSSEGSAGGQEYDVYVGYGADMGGWSYDLNLTAYEYPAAPGTGTMGNSLGDFSEFILSLGFGNFSFSFVDSLQGGGHGGNYIYYSFGYEMGSFGVLLGMWDLGGASASSSLDDVEMTHLDLSYSATDELSFTLSTVIDDDPERAFDHDTLFVVGYTKSFDL